MTASDESVLESLTNSAERIVSAVVQMGAKVVSETHHAVSIERVEREMRQARTIGQFAVLTASAKLKNLLGPNETAPTDPTPQTTADDVRPHPPRGIPDYENLSAAQIVPLLRALTAEERDEVLAFEDATRQRKTIVTALRPRSK